MFMDDEFISVGIFLFVMIVVALYQGYQYYKKYSQGSQKSQSWYVHIVLNNQQILLFVP